MKLQPIEQGTPLKSFRTDLGHALAFKNAKGQWHGFVISDPSVAAVVAEYFNQMANALWKAEDAKPNE